jgi:uncharacterized membrane protein YfcA
VLDLSVSITALVAATSLVAALIGGVTGMSTGILVLPVFTFAFGIQSAIPIVTIAMMLNTAARAASNWRHVDTTVACWFSLGAIPAAIAGSIVFANAPTDFLARGLGVFLLVLVAYGHLPSASTKQMPLRGFLPVGIGQGFLSAVFGGAGPFGARFYMSYGLTRNSFVGTVAIGTFLISVAKAVSYSSLALLDWESVFVAVAIGLIMSLGAYGGARIVSRVRERAFVYIVESVMLLSGLALLVIG